MQTIESMQPLRQIITQTCARYATITPAGIILVGSDRPYNPLPVTIVAYKSARTRYVNRHPVCRSLNGISAVTGQKRCITCEDKRVCTPQISLEIMYRAVPFRILIAYTSAKNFLLFTRSLFTHQQQLERTPIEISVIDRGRWGEVCFTVAKTSNISTK